jgi:hypothetical protein
MSKKEKKLKIEDFWWFHNYDCWRVQRQDHVDVYLYVPTMKYIYKTPYGEWQGTKDIMSFVSKRKKFKSEHDAIKWLTKL